MGSYCGKDDKQYEYYGSLTFENYSNALRLILETQDIDIFDDEIMNKHPNVAANNKSKLIIEKLSSGNYLNAFFYDEIYENEEHLIGPILDNDTAAEMAIQSLSTIPILESIKIMKLPTLDFCVAYPTIGPDGRDYSILMDWRLA
jgi:hypothetical protein